jgi:DDE_Tnp_1-associated
LGDPFTGNAARHDFLEVLLIALCRALCDSQTPVGMAEFAEAKEEFLREFLKLENGLPSHDTSSQIFRLPDPDEFSVCFRRFTARFAAEHGVIAIDGKVSRRPFDRCNAKSALHMAVPNW